jgi:malate/lactate dehydrogenase
MQPDLDGVFQTVKNAAYDIIRLRGATYFAIALGTTRMIEAILGGRRRWSPQAHCCKTLRIPKM